MATEQNYTVFRRAPWGGAVGDGDVIVWDVDWSAATFLWQIGSPSDLAIDISLANASAGSQGVSASYAPAYEHPTSGAIGPATVIRPQIDEATLEALTYTGTDDLVLAYTFYVTPSGAPERVLQYGTMTIKQGVADS